MYLLLSVITLFACKNIYTAHAALYGSNDPITQLFTEDFVSTVISSPTSWVVEFYSTWCGHCQRFAPKYVRFANGIKEWSSVVRVGAVDCSETKNTGLCRLYNVRGYPTVKFFPRLAHDRQQGYLYNGVHDTIPLLHATIDYLRTERVVNERPNINPVYSTQEARNRRQSSTDTVILIAVRGSNEDRYMVSQVIYDLSAFHPETVVTWANSAYLQPYGIVQYPSLYTVDDVGRTQFIGSPRTREEMVAQIRRVIRKSVFTSTPLLITTTVPTLTYGYTPPDGVHSQDVDSNIYFSFWREIGSQASITGERLAALKRYVNILARYFAGSEHVRRLIGKVDRWLQKRIVGFTGEDWIIHITNLQDSASYVPQEIRWVSCEGSQTRYRGYPCSLWTNFHALTVNAYLGGARRGFNPQEVLQAIRDYMKYFFGCRECADHFESMAVNIEREVMRSYDAILWLWRAHNKVNDRLKNDQTTDPEQAKVQFPVASACPSCKTRDRNGREQWVDTRVVMYLMHFYRRENLIMDSQPYEFLSHATTPVPQIEHEAHTPECPDQSTEWSSCSRSCGTGVSWRMSNNNAECEIKMEHRVCFLRPCDARFSNKYQPSCSYRSATYRQYLSSYLTYGSCRTENRYAWRYCGMCNGLCCKPQQSTTTEIYLLCENNGQQLRGKTKMEFIDTCSCEQCEY